MQKTSHQNRVNLKIKQLKQNFTTLLSTLFSTIFDQKCNNIYAVFSHFFQFDRLLQKNGHQTMVNLKKNQAQFSPYTTDFIYIDFSIKNAIEYPHFSRISLDRKIIDIITAND